MYIQLDGDGFISNEDGRISETIKEITILGAEIWHLPISKKERHRSEPMNESTVVLNLGSMCALILLLKIEVNISVFVSGQNNDTWNYVWLGEFGQVSSRSTFSSMKRFQGSCINSIMILNHGSLKVCLHHLGWRLFMEFKKSASPKVDQNPEVKSEKKLSLALFIVRWTFHNFLLENSLLKIAHSIID